MSSGSSERGSKSPLKRAQEQSPRKRGRPPKDEKDLTIPESSTVKGVMAGPMAAFKWQPTVSEPVKDADPHFHHFLLSQTEKPAVCYQAITKKLKICEEGDGVHLHPGSRQHGCEWQHHTHRQKDRIFGSWPHGKWHRLQLVENGSHSDCLEQDRREM